MEVFMNRNFAKISVAIVALVLVLAFCMTGCKINDVAADLDNTKNEVSANKTDAAKALEEAIKALEAKIAANDADCAAEIAALNAAVEAVKKAGEATDADLAAAEKTLNAAIDAVRASLDATKTELSDKIVANDAKINAEVAALNAAIANAEAALKAAGAADKAALEESLAAAKAELEAALAALKADVEKLTAYVDEAVAALQADIAAGNKDLTSAIVELKNALELASGEAADADAALKAELEQAIAEAVKAVIDVVEIADAALQAQVDVNAADIAAANAALEAAKVALEEADAALKAELEGKISELQATLETVIEDVKTALQAQIAANAADIADAVEALEAAKVALETADATNREELENMIAELEEAVNGRIDELEAALQAQIDGNAADIAAATQAIADAKAALEAAQAADKTELSGKISALETAVSNLETTLNNKIDDVKAELEEKIDGLTALLGDLGNNTTVIGSIAEINAAIEALGNTDAAVAEDILAIEADIEALYGVIAEYRETTEEVVKAWHEIFATYKNWVECSAAYGVSAEDMLALEAEYASVQIRLYRALNAEEVVAIKDAFFTAIENVESGELDALYKIYNNLVAAENGLAAADELATIRAALDLARAGLDARTEAKLIIDGKVVDLYEKYAAACVVYNNARIAALEAEYEAIVNNINEANELADVEAIDALIAEFKAVVDTFAAETEAGIPVAGEIVAKFNNEHVDLLMRTADKYLEICIELVNNVTVENIGDVENTVNNALNKMVEERLPAMEALGIDVYGLGTKVAATRVSIVDKYIGFVEAGIAAAETLEDLVDDWATIEAISDKIAALEALGIDVAAPVEGRDALVSAYFAKYVDIYAATLTAEMNAYIDNLGAIFAEVKAGTTNIADIRADYFAFVDNRDFAEALHSDSEAVAALVAAEAAFVKVEEQFATLAALVVEADGVAAILDNEVFATIEGANVEYLVIKDYRLAAKAWVEALDALYAGFTAEANAEAYNEIRALIDEVKFEEITVEFEESIKTLVEIARELIATIEKIKTDVETNGQRFTAIVDIQEAWAEFRTWEQNATDADGVGFIISYVSNEAYTNENLNTVLVNIQTAYEAYVEVARIEWADRYIGTHQQALVEGTATLTYKDDLSATREWFDTYGIVDAAFAAEHNIIGIGVAEIEAQLTAREAELAQLKADREALIAALEAKREELQNTINNIGAITTDSVDELAALEAACAAWAEACVANEVELEALDLTKLAEAKAALAELQAKAEYIKGLIAALEIPTLGTNSAAPYFADAAAKDAYVAYVANVKAELAAFDVANDGYRGCFTEEELAKVEATNSELYVSKYEAALNVYNAYVAAIEGITDEAVLAQMAEYLELARADIDAVGQIAVFTTAGLDEILDAICAYYIAKMDATVELYDVYEETTQIVANQAVLAKMAEVFYNAVNAVADTEDVADLDGIVGLCDNKLSAVVGVYNAYTEAAEAIENVAVVGNLEVILNNAVNAVVGAEDVVAIADATEFCNVKIDATVEVYNAYVELTDGIEDVAVLTKMATFLGNASAKIVDAAEVDAIEDAVELGTVKLESTNAVYNAYVATAEGVEDSIILAKMATYFNEAINQIEKTETNNYIAYIQQIGTTAAGKFEDIKNNKDVNIEVPVCEHVYDNACDTACNKCDEVREVPAHVYYNACDTSCNICGWEREVPAHVYDNACDTDCNECGVVREVPAHVYDNACDAFCNVCEAERNVPAHVFDNACDVDCNVCGVVREVGDHVYDDECDADCNECGKVDETRGHIYSGICDPDCDVCGEVRTTGGHAFDNACDTVCNECGAVREVPAHVFDNACDTDCNECGVVREVPAHVYDNACDTDCNECGVVREVPAHVYDNACDVDCNVCGVVREVADHVYDDECDVDCNECGKVDEIRGHVYDNACDVDCNTCGTVREVGDHVYDHNCDNNCNECGVYRETMHADADFDGLCDACSFVQGASAEWPLELQPGWTFTPEFVAGTSLADPGIQRYYYTYTVEKDGLLIVNTFDAAIVIFVNGEVQLDGYDPATTVAVKAGDIVELNVENAEWTLDAVSFTAEVAVLGSENNPFVPSLGTNTTPEFVQGTSMMDPGISTYYYSFVAQGKGTFTVSTADAVVIFFINGNIQLDANYEPLAVVTVNSGDVVEITVENANWALDAVSFTLAFDCDHNYVMNEVGAFVCSACSDTVAPVTFAAGEGLYNRIVVGGNDLSSALANGSLSYNEEGYITISGMTTNPDIGFGPDPGVDKVVAVPFGPAFDGEGAPTSGRYIVIRYRTDTATAQFKFVTWNVPSVAVFSAGTAGEWETAVVDLTDTAAAHQRFDIRCNIDANTTDISHIASFETLEDAQAYLAIYNESIACEEHPGYKLTASGKVKCTECGLTVVSPHSYAAGTALTNIFAGAPWTTATNYSYDAEGGFVRVTGMSATPTDPSSDLAYGVWTPAHRYIIVRFRASEAGVAIRVITTGAAITDNMTAPTDAANQWKTVLVDKGVGVEDLVVSLRCNVGATSADTYSEISHIVSFATLEEAQAYANLMGSSMDGACPHYGYTTTTTREPSCAAPGEQLLECAACGLEVTVPVEHTGGHGNVVTGAEYGLADGQVKCTICETISTPVTYQAGADLFAAVDPTSQDYALVTGGAAGVTVNGTGSHAYGPGANLKLTSGVEYGKYMVTVYKIASAGHLGVSVDDGLASYVELPVAATWAISNYSVGTTNLSGEQGTTGSTGTSLELICNFGGITSSVSLYGVVTFNTAEEAALFAEYLAPLLGYLPN